jgi:hypothetical protein
MSFFRPATPIEDAGMKTDRVRDMLKRMAQRAVANGISFEAFSSGLKPEYVERAKTLYEAAKAEQH